MINGNIDDLAVCIAQTSGYFQQQAQKQVNAALTLRNWSIGFYLFEYEQHGRDRAEYGSKLPLDINIQTEHTRVFIPITSMLVISLILNLLMRLFNR